VEVRDPQNRNAKTRPAVIVSRADEIESEGLIDCVAVTSMIPDDLPDDCVLLPFSAGGRSRTGLKMRSAAMCSWLFEITEDKIEKYIGVTPQKALDAILAYLEKHKKT